MWNAQSEKKRPGKIRHELTADFTREGYRLQTSAIETPGLIEVYPHPALVELGQAKERLPYKTSKMLRYWPKLPRNERRSLLLGEWVKIIDLLEGQIEGTKRALAPLPPDSPMWMLKSYEDKIDAVVCAYVAICALEARAVPFGDHESAIWIPKGA
jgi:predicted RNase H-like nuclease